MDEICAMKLAASGILVSTLDDARANVRRFAIELDRHTDLVRRLRYVHSWYADRAPDGTWIFGPSLFVGYKGNTGQRYVQMAKSGGTARGRNTEWALADWFEEVDQQTPLGRELADALRVFLARWDRTPRTPVRIHVSKSELNEIPDLRQGREANASEGVLARISIDPRICGGRPCIKGTRMRVSDIVDMLAEGATRQAILADYPYLAGEDIAAALAYAARATDHRVIRAA
jgi:uncharacterized protein (DUF433 family)